MKIVIVYDSLTGNTEKMAKAIAEGAGSVEGAVVEVKKVGEPFPLSKLTGANGVFFGSPCNYANVTPNMQGFLENLKDYVQAGRMNVKGKKAAVFGSYGWDGAWVMEEKLKGLVQDIGYSVKEEACVEVGTSIQYHPDDHLAKCKAFGMEFAEALKK
ncbi:MAG: FprA family A-type flavoprotein [Candidatus Bathyarchaeota archaeon]|nr:MAG: FprA family A-type flavoprotein [Candidatus Bathyarchaeota archaeon]